MAGKNTQERIENEMEKYGLVRIKDNDHHRSVWTGMCSCCTNKLEIPQGGELIVSNRLLEIARKRGWRLGYKHAATCPNCLNAIKDKVKRNKAQKEKTMDARMTALKQETPPTPAPAPVATPAPVIASIGPAPMPIATVLKISAELELHFNRGTRRYNGVESDESVSKRTGFSIEAVKRVRIEGGYGELAEDPALAKFAQALAVLETQYDGRITKLMSDYDADMKALKAQFALLTKTHKAGG